jgi:hypothetical protein
VEGKAAAGGRGGRGGGGWKGEGGKGADEAGRKKEEEKKARIRTEWKWRRRRQRKRKTTPVQRRTNAENETQQQPPRFHRLLSSEMEPNRSVARGGGLFVLIFSLWFLRREVFVCPYDKYYFLKRCFTQLYIYIRILY